MMLRLLFSFLFLAISFLSFSQNQNRSFNKKVKSMSVLKGHRLYIDGLIKDSLKSLEGPEKKQFEKQLYQNLKSLENKIDIDFNQSFTSNEIAEIERFYQSKLGKKMANFYEKWHNKSFENFEELQAEFNRITSVLKRRRSYRYRVTDISNRDINKQNSLKQDGFYEVIEYDPTLSVDKAKLFPNPSISKADFKFAKKIKNHLGDFIIEIQLTDEATVKLEELTKNNINKPLAIVLNHQIVMVPYIIETIKEGVIHISGVGRFSEDEIDEYINQVNSKN